MIVSSTEPPAIKSLGRSSQLPESFGADILIPHLGGFAGIQRKAIPDFIASQEDGRLAKELGQMKRLTVALLILEGPLSYTVDGNLITGRRATRWTRTSIRNLLRSIQASGVWVEHTASSAETVEAARSFEQWLKSDHTSTSRRPGPVSVWGRVDNRDWACHLLMGFPGIGPSLAEGIVDRFGGVPLRWTVTEKELATVAKIGPKKAKSLIRALEPINAT